MRFQFIFNNKEVKANTILFKNLTPILDIEKIVYFKETELSGNWLKKEFRYSFDNVIWSNWATFTQQALTNIQFKNNSNFYLEALYTRQTYISASIQDLYLFYDAVVATRVDPVPTDYPYENLHIYNVPESSTGVSIYDASARVDAASGVSLYFKKIQGAGGIVVYDGSNGAIIIDVSGGSGGGGIYQNPSPVTQTVGGIVNNTPFFADAKSFADTMAAMFYPTLYPTLTNPSNTFADNIPSPNLKIAGESINLTFTSTFNRGTINPAYGTNGYRSGNPNAYIYTGAGITGTISSTSLSNTINANGYVVVLGMQPDWTSRVSYDGGDHPLDSTGAAYGSALPAGTTGAVSSTFEGVYPIFATTVNITTLTQQPLQSMISGNNIVISMVTESGGNKQRFQLPKPWTDSRPLKGIQQYNTFSSSWDYPGGSQSASLAFWTKTSDINIINSNNINYLVYTHNGVDRGGVDIRLVF